MAAGSPQRQDSMILDIEVDLNIPSTMFYLTKKWPSPLSFKERETPLHPAVRGVAGTLWLSSIPGEMVSPKFMKKQLSSVSLRRFPISCVCTS